MKGDYEDYYYLKAENEDTIININEMCIRDSHNKRQDITWRN